MKNHLTTLLCVPALIAPAFAASHWGTDLPAAQAQAAQLDGFVLIDFTGSDWCGPCIALNKELFNTAEFSQYAKQNKLVLMEVDVPRQKAQEAKLQASNKAIVQKYKIFSYPTVLILSPEGYVLGGFIGYANKQKAQSELEQQLTHAQALKKELAAAATLKGKKKAQVLLSIYNKLPERIQGHNPALIEQIISLTPNDELGVKKEAARKEIAKQQMREARKRISSARSDRALRLQKIEEELKNAAQSEPEVRAMLYTSKADIYYFSSKTEADLATAKANYLLAADCKPKTAAANKAKIEAFFANPEVILSKTGRSASPPRP